MLTDLNPPLLCRRSIDAAARLRIEKMQAVGFWPHMQHLSTGGGGGGGKAQRDLRIVSRDPAIAESIRAQMLDRAQLDRKGIRTLGGYDQILWAHAKAQEALPWQDKGQLDRKSVV